MCYSTYVLVSTFEFQKLGFKGYYRNMVPVYTHKYW